MSARPPSSCDSQLSIEPLYEMIPVESGTCGWQWLRCRWACRRGGNYTSSILGGSGKIFRLRHIKVVPLCIGRCVSAVIGDLQSVSEATTSEEAMPVD